MMERLNRECFCTGLDDQRLTQALASSDLEELVRDRCPHAFAARPVFVNSADMDRMAAVVRALESVVALPTYREAVLSAAPSIARHRPQGARGVFFGYDFHLDHGRLSLIEINTNAGGAMLSAIAARAQRSCCEAVEQLLPQAPPVDALERSIVAMFRNEWRLAGHDTPLRSIAIVDGDPPSQYLYPEFLLFRRLFAEHGLRAVICDPAALRFEHGGLWVDDVRIDLVYNRLTDFNLADEASRSLREAYLADAVVLTPHPQAHALYADKRNLTLFSDDSRLRELGVPAAERELLAQTVPHTRWVGSEDGDALWGQRRGLFFKPRAGFGSRAAYRGDKLTRRVWEQILAGDYVAQNLVAPGERAVDGEAGTHPLKFDLRNYVYDRSVQWVAARLYQGQTTNFRTPGGGFAPTHRMHLLTQSAEPAARPSLRQCQPPEALVPRATTTDAAPGDGCALTIMRSRSAQPEPTCT
jgi:hypothetical protein